MGWNKSWKSWMISETTKMSKAPSWSKSIKATIPRLSPKEKYSSAVPIHLFRLSVQSKKNASRQHQKNLRHQLHQYRWTGLSPTCHQVHSHRWLTQPSKSHQDLRHRFQQKLLQVLLYLHRLNSQIQKHFLELPNDS